MKKKLRIATINRNYCRKVAATSGELCQIGLVQEWKRERTDYLCEMKFSQHEFTIDKKNEKEPGNKNYALLSSKQHIKTHSIQLVMVTTNGVIRNEHSKEINQPIILDDLFF